VPDKKITAKHIIIQIIGYFILFLSFSFLGYRLWANRAEFVGIHFDFFLVMMFIMASITYCLSSFILTLAWQRCLNIFDENKVDFLLCFSIYARSQIAKYIPGNIVQIAGRHALGKVEGLSHTSLAMAALCEIIGLITSACVIKILADLTSYTFFALPFFFLLFLTILLFLLPFILLKFKIQLLPDSEISKRSYFQLLSRVFSVIFIYFLFHLIAGTALLLLIFGFNFSIVLMGSVELISIFAVSWLAGFLTPGSPAGLGVREAVMVAMLGVIIGGPNSLVVAFLFRLVTVLGDVMTFFIPYVLIRTK